MNLTPIETSYKGYKFRSRLEAKWAVFFDLLRVNWTFEPEGFQLKRLKYLPDFELTEIPVFLWIESHESNTGNSVLLPLITENVWVEIKPDRELQPTENKKIEDFVEGLRNQDFLSLYIVTRGDPYNCCATLFAWLCGYDKSIDYRGSGFYAASFCRPYSVCKTLSTSGIVLYPWKHKFNYHPAYALIESLEARSFRFDGW